MRTTAARVAGLLAGALLLAGCAGVTVESTSEATAVIGSPTNEGMDALLVGTAVIENGCWAIRADDGGVHHVFWPAGTTLTGEGVQAPGVTKPIADGGAVHASGGEVPATEIPASAHDCWGDKDVVFSAWSVEFGG